MIVNIQQLNKNLFEKDVEQIPIRQGFGEGLLLAAKGDERVVGLCADLTDSTKMNLFRDAYPHRFIQMGVAEQNMAAVASGMAAMGKIPYLSSYAMFSPGRNWEQIRTTICYNDRKVIIVGSHAGVSVGPDGGTHQALEDIAITRVIPNIDVVVPCDAIEARKATLALAISKGPAYLRLSREKTPVITTEASPFALGKVSILRKPEHPTLAIIACGPMVYNALMAAAKLSNKGVEALVINMHTIKPLDQETILWAAKTSGAIVTVEEHQRHGGMGSAISEFLVEHCPVPMEIMGVDDRFGQSGAPEELIKYYGLGVDKIVERGEKAAARLR